MESQLNFLTNHIAIGFVASFLLASSSFGQPTNTQISDTVEGNLKSVQTAATGNCPTGFIPHGDKCFKFIIKRMNFGDALAECNGYNDGLFPYQYSLASIHDSSDSEFVVGQKGKASHALTRAHWLGLHFENGQFKWTDGSELDYTAWNNAEPNGEANEPCVEMSVLDATAGKWKNTRCEFLRWPVCMRYKDCSWHEVKGARLMSSNLHITTAPTLKSCQEACLDHAAFQCKSVDYRPAKSKCVLSSDDRRSSMLNMTKPYYVFSDYQCAGYTKTACTGRAPIAALPASSPLEVTAASVDQCQEICRQDARILCSAFAFNPTTKKCISYNDEHRQSSLAPSQGYQSYELTCGQSQVYSSL